jgi:molybdopterin-guanine dinucleotide biosynthesis protein A
MSMQAAGGYVLAGGQSRRMGTDKANLPWRGVTLGVWVAGEISAVTGGVTIVGASWPGYRSIPDALPDFGPVAGIAAALGDTCHEWNLIVACDMPRAGREWLRGLLEAATGDVLLPQTADGRLHPLCAAWHRNAARPMAEAVRRGIHPVQEAIRLLDYRVLRVSHAEIVTNINTPEEWACCRE